MNTYFQKGAFKRAAVAVGATLSGLALVGVAGSPAAFAAEGDVDVTNTETVQVYLDSEGKVQSRRVYEQLTLTGVGTADIANPIETDGLRNLDGFSGFDVEDGVQQLSVDVDGVKRLRSVSDYSGELPLQVSIEYRLDGEVVSPDDVVGADGALEVIYTVKNVTAAPQEITYPDGKGGTITKNAEVPIPMVGSLTTIAPANFTDVQSSGANMAGDGKGGTKLSFTMTLFPPLGSDEVSFGYTANISDGVVPAASISALPVNPLESPTFKTAGESYKSGSETGAKLANGATEIDSNLLKLRDGAADLLGGLIKLSDGADELNAGLAGEAAPGAEQLASGALQLDEGLGQLDDGAGQLSDGASKLSVGASDAHTGSQQLEDGLRQISGGLDQLAATEGLPAAQEGIKQLKAGIGLISAGLGDTARPKTLIGGLHALEQGLGTAELGAGRLAGGLDQMRGDAGNDMDPMDGSGLAKARNAVDLIKGGLEQSLAKGGSLDQLVGGLTVLKSQFCSTHPAKDACEGVVDQLLAGTAKSRTDLTTAAGGLGLVSSGLGDALATLTIPATGCNPTAPHIRCGAAALAAGITKAKTGAGDLKQGAIELKGGVLKVDGGLTDLSAGITKAVAGVLKLSEGAGAAYSGSGELTDGLGLIAGGSNELADGAGRLANGTGEARDGSKQLADGAGKLSEGLGDAADGSGQLADGLDQAEEGAPKIVDGAGMLSTVGMSQLIEAGNATAQDYGKMYAVIGAAGDRADSEKMAYGAPENAQGLTAYTFELVGNDGEGGRNTTRGLLALGLLGLGLGAFALRRRLV